MDFPVANLVTGMIQESPVAEPHVIPRPGRFPRVFEAQVTAGGQKLRPGNGHRVVGAQTQAPGAEEVAIGAWDPPLTHGL